VLTTLLLLAWLAAALRTTALLPRRLPFADRLPFARSGDMPAPRRDWDGDRIALVALPLVAIAFGLQSIVDWTWFVPGPMAMALVAAGFVAGRGPQPALAASPAGPAGPAAGPAARFRRPDTGRIVAAAGVVLAGLVLAWAIWQPEASDRATGNALELSDQGRFDEALAEADSAADTNPLTPEPLLVRASIQTAAGNEADARESLEQAVLGFPGDPQTWYRLAAFQLGTLDRPDQALETLRGALYLDPFSKPAQGLFLEARARQRELETLEARQRQQPPP
jgi:tetratricopeptide (TPR) repeat protein